MLKNRYDVNLITFKLTINSLTTDIIKEIEKYEQNTIYAYNCMTKMKYKKCVCKSANNKINDSRLKEINKDTRCAKLECGMYIRVRWNMA